MKKLFTLILLLVSTGVTLAQAIAEDQFLVKPYLQFSTQTGMYVLWETAENATTRVDFGEARRSVNRAVLDRRATLPGTRLMHEVFLDSLKAETNYFWQVTSITEKGDTLRSEVYSFKTAVQDSSAYMFALIGDTQRNSSTPWAWGKIAGLVWQKRPNFVIHVGDLVDQGLKKTDWTEHFFPFGHPLMSRVPVYPVLGNHENDSPLYYQYIVAPQPEYYYTFTYGNAQFFMLDSNRDLDDDSEQYKWLEWELAKSNATWKIVAHHHPPYSSDNDDYGDSFREISDLGDEKVRNLIPLYERYGVDFCLFGHTHLYERTWPMLENRINMKEGVVYINSGGAGGMIENFAPTRSWFTLEMQAVHHFCTFAIYDRTVMFKAIDHEGRLLDAFQMQKERPDQRQSQVVQPPGPQIRTDGLLFENQTRVKIAAAFDSLEIRYTLDGSEPTRSSALYNRPLTIDRSATLTARAYTRDGRASRPVTTSFRKMAPQAPVAVQKTERGLRFSYYESENTWSLMPDFAKLKPVKTGRSAQVSLHDLDHRDENFGVLLEGYVEVPETGLYTFFTISDDGSKLYINDELIVDNDGSHSATRRTGQTLLRTGKHQLRVEYFQGRMGRSLQAGIVDAKMGDVPFSPFQLSH
ncbi:MAG TPA: metallophosphoesterase [Saprospiraceae bacterium]|nr:metallophosphoesterase [Saprospiraceae bacterium]HMP23109.1 metallophosphoesterase [Saprospiraceae bacterium]